MDKEMSSSIYGSKDPRESPIYTTTEAARYLRIPIATLRSWIVGREYPTRGTRGFFMPLIQRPDTTASGLSFNNLVEAHILRALRHKHQVSIKKVRTALEYAHDQYGIDRLLLNKDLLHSDAGELFLERYGQLINLSRAGQLAMKAILKDHLERLEWDLRNMPARLFPYSSERADRRIIVIDPFVSFGRPVIKTKKISTSVIADRVDAGESIESVADDYDLGQNEVMEALVYERAA
jgi:uncharacterized protein (DUF433 family)